MTTTRRLAILLAIALVFTLGGCGKSDDTPLATSDYLPPHQPAMDTGIIELLPATQASSIMGMPMTASDPYEDGTMVAYTSADNKKQVLVNMKNTSATLFDADIAELTDSEAIPALGERAIWCPATDEVICYHGGYAIGVSVTNPAVANTRGLCEAIADKIISNIG